MSIHNPAHCPLCGGANDCQLCTASMYKGLCWCARVEIPAELITRVPAELLNKACICHDCIASFVPTGKPGQFSPTLEPGDYYIDKQGLMVFTAAYHLRRGHCCQSKCRHCPY